MSATKPPVKPPMGTELPALMTAPSTITRPWFKFVALLSHPDEDCPVWNPNAPGQFVLKGLFARPESRSPTLNPGTPGLQKTPTPPMHIPESVPGA